MNDEGPDAVYDPDVRGSRGEGPDEPGVVLSRHSAPDRYIHEYLREAFRLGSLEHSVKIPRAHGVDTSEMRFDVSKALRAMPLEWEGTGREFEWTLRALGIFTYSSADALPIVCEEAAFIDLSAI